MFLFECPACGRRELRSARALSSFASTATGIELAFVCTRCGSTVHTVTGVRAAATPALDPAASPASTAAPAAASTGVAA